MGKSSGCPHTDLVFPGCTSGLTISPSTTIIGLSKLHSIKHSTFKIVHNYACKCFLFCSWSQYLHEYKQVLTNFMHQLLMSAQLPISPLKIVSQALSSSACPRRLLSVRRNFRVMYCILLPWLNNAKNGVLGTSKIQNSNFRISMDFLDLCLPLRSSRSHCIRDDTTKKFIIITI